MDPPTEMAVAKSNLSEESTHAEWLGPRNLLSSDVLLHKLPSVTVDSKTH